MAFGVSSCGLTVMMSTLAKWFHTNLGKASGILISGFGLSGTLVPAITALINQYGWRTTFLIMGIGAFIIITPLSLVFRSGIPQNEETESNIGTAIDNSRSGIPAISKAETGFGIGQLLKNTIFWKIAMIFTLHRILVSTVITHIMPYLEGSPISMSNQTASLVAMALTLTSIPGRLGFGWLADKYNKKLVASAALVLMLFGMLFLANISSSLVWLSIPFVILFAIGYGGNNTLRPALLGEYFGRARFGTAFGLVMSINALGGIGGPPLAGLAYDQWNSYSTVWYANIGIAIITILLILSLSKSNMNEPNASDK
jgi:MFS family permease